MDVLDRRNRLKTKLHRLNIDKKIHLVWDDVVGMQLHFLKKDADTPIYNSLMMSNGEESGWDENDLSSQVFLIGSNDEMIYVSETIANVFHVPAKTIERSLYLQNAFFTALGSGWVQKPFNSITLSDIHQHIVASPPVSILEFDCILRGPFYSWGFRDISNPRHITPHSTLEVARMQASEVELMKLHLIPFKQRLFDNFDDQVKGDVVNKDTKYIMTVHNEFATLLVKDNDGFLVKDPVTFQFIPKDKAIILDKVWYNRKTMRELYCRGGTRVPHSRSKITFKIFKLIFKD